MTPNASKSPFDVIIIGIWFHILPTESDLSAYPTRQFVLCLTLCYFFLCFSVLLAFRLPRLGKKELILVFFVRLFDLRLFGFVCFLFLLVSGKGSLPHPSNRVGLVGLSYEAICFMSYLVILFLCFSVLLAFQLPLLEKRELILVLFIRLFYLRLFGFVCFLFLLVSGKGCDL